MGLRRDDGAEAAVGKSGGNGRRIARAANQISIPWRYRRPDRRSDDRRLISRERTIHMAGYKLIFDRPAGIVTCRLASHFHARELAPMARDVAAIVRAARVDGPLRLVWDDRSGQALPPEIVAAIRTSLGQGRLPADRFAIIAHDGAADGPLRPNIIDGGETFASESAALAWLGPVVALAA
jgi:hypothetical protein